MATITNSPHSNVFSNERNQSLDTLVLSVMVLFRKVPVCRSGCTFNNDAAVRRALLPQRLGEAMESFLQSPERKLATHLKGVSLRMERSQKGQ